MKISVPVAFSLVAVEVPLNFAEFQQARADSPTRWGGAVDPYGLPWITPAGKNHPKPCSTASVRVTGSE